MLTGLVSSSGRGSSGWLVLLLPLLPATPTAYVHSHLSESKGEIALVRQLFPWAKDYTDVYDRFGLLGCRSLFAHGVHLSERECARLSEAGATVVHCPSSNSLLGSGLFDASYVGRPDRPVRIGIATDIGGGTSYSVLYTLGEAYKVAMLQGQTPTARELFHRATRGNAVHLNLADEIGTLDLGRWVGRGGARSDCYTGVARAAGTVRVPRRHSLLPDDPRR